MTDASSDLPLRYQPDPGRYDEALDIDGTPRAAWVPLINAVAASGIGVLSERQRQADRLLDAEGAGHLVHDMALDSERAVWDEDSRPWRLDPIPLVLDGGEFAELAAGVAQRMRLLEAIVRDAYGPRDLVVRGLVPGTALHGSPRYQLGAQGIDPPSGQHIVTYAVDLVRLADGSWRVVQDLTDAPAGLGYTLLDRSVMARLFPDTFRQYGVASIGDHTVRLRQALAAQAPAGRTSPRTVLFTGGLGHAYYIEHSYLAVQLGFHLAEGADLVVRSGRLWLRALGGLEPVDVVLRRLEDASLDPLDVPSAVGSGVPAISLAARRGGVAIANAYGSGLAEERALWPFHERVAQEVFGERLLLEAIDPEGPLPPLASTPQYRAQSLVPGVTVLRLHAVAGPDGVHVLPGGSGRVLAAGDMPHLPTARVVKDVWVVGLGRSNVLVSAPKAMPQVDFSASIPTRSADALYWMGRAAERAEVAARTARVLGVQLDQDPGLATLGSGGWGQGALAILRASQARPFPLDDTSGTPMNELLAAELELTNQVVASQLGALLQEAVTVREFLSVTTGRVLGRLARSRTDIAGSDVAVDDLDGVLVDLAALAGLTTESTVRGPAWRFLDLGRRLERSLAVLGSVEAALGLAVEPLCLQPLADAVLAANDSLVAYRRRHRSDVELDAVVDLLVHDDANPRSLAFQLDRLREHTAALTWSDGSELVERASRALLETGDGRLSGGRRLGIDQMVLSTRGPLLDLGAQVVARWFADPVDPHSMGGW
jgi:uncharacterized circularly permuted ATP-grasp superfamily protein/uncharacterized alpha-E superfamily protein